MKNVPVVLNLTEEENAMLIEASHAIRLSPQNFLRLQIHAQYLAMQVLKKLHANVKNLLPNG